MKTTINDLYVDIWLEIFEYFNAVEVFTSLVHVTRTLDEFLFHKNQRIYLRQLILDVDRRYLPKKLPVDQVISLEIHEESRIDIVNQCSKLRCLKLVGQAEWIIFILKKISNAEMNLQQLILVTPSIHLLPQIFSSITSNLSIGRLEIYANQLEEKMKIGSCLPVQINVEQFLLDTCSPIDFYELTYILSTFSGVHLLNITLASDNRTFCSLPILPNLQHIYLKLFEVPFEWVIYLVRGAPILTKLKLMGLVNQEGFIVNHKWIHLFQSCPSLSAIIVNLSLQTDPYFHFNEMKQRLLREMDLNLALIDDESDIFSCETSDHRWLKLAGTVLRDRIRL